MLMTMNLSVSTLSLISVILVIRQQFVDTLFIVRLRTNMSMHHAVIINYYFLVHKIEIENLIL